MPTYSYTAKSLQGEEVSGEKTAKSERDLAGLLRQDGFVLVTANEMGRLKKISFFAAIKNSIPFLGKISLAEKMMFTKNLQVMVKAGITLPRGLQILSTQSKNAQFKKALEAISNDISKGRNFSDALGKYPQIFSELFQSMVAVGETSGTLEDVLRVLTKQMEREHELKSKIKGAMTYPIVILVAMVGVGIVMMITVVPKLSDTFTELKVELPPSTKIVIGLGNFLAQFWYLVPLIALVLFFLIRFILSLKMGKKATDGLFLRMPAIGPLIKKTNAAYTARTLASLITAGVPIVRALEVVAKTLSNSYFREAIIQAAEKVSRGADLSTALKPYQNIYPSLVVQMIEVGEETGQSAEILEKLADFYEAEVSDATKNISSIVEPVLMIIIGVVVAFFAVSMIQPMYSMMDSI